MSKDEFLREAMTRAASSEPGVGDAWSRFQHKRERGKVMRAGVVTVSLAAVGVAMFLTLPGLNQKDNSGFVGGGALNPVGNLKTYVDPIVGFQFDYPADWVVEGAPGRKVVIHPSGKYQSATHCRTCQPADVQYVYQPYVEVLIAKRAPQPACTSSTQCGEVPDITDHAEVSVGDRTIDGRYAYTSDVVYESVTVVRGDKFTVRWCSECHIAEIGLNDWYGGMTGWDITVRLTFPAGNESAGLQSARAIVDSFRRYPAVPGASIVASARPTTVPPPSPTSSASESPPPPAVGTGIEGSVYASAACRNSTPPCMVPDRALAAHIVVRDSSGGIVAETDSGSDGQFRVAVAAGSYTLHSSSKDASSCEDAHADVADGKYTTVSISCTY